MVDWDQVERLRSKGWDWDRIANEPKAEFHADSDAGDPGRALRTLYYQRRSKQQRRPVKDREAEGSASESGTRTSAWSLARIGFLLFPLLLVWFILAELFPSPVGAYLQAIPVVGLLLAVAAAILAFGLLRSPEKWTKTFRSTFVVGIVLGGIVAGGLGLAGVVNGCPTLPPVSGSEPQSWQKAGGPGWTENGLPVLYFYGSVACPYCSASSWAVKKTLDRFGTLTGYSYLQSKVDDVYSKTPEIVLAGASYQSSYLSLVVLESTDDTQITDPTPSSCVQQAYVAAYDAGPSIPFIVIGGHYLHVGTIVDPGTMGTGNPSVPSQWFANSSAQIQGQIDNQSGPAYAAISTAAYLMEAFVVKANGGQPATVFNDPNVQNYLKQIS